MKNVARDLRGIYQRLLAHFGRQHWWPARTRFEVMVGAILTQNTSWGNVEKAVDRLRQEDFLKPGRLKNISAKRLSGLIKPAGYFNVKAGRLKNFVDFYFCEYQGQLHRMAQDNIFSLRKKLLGVNGIGPETADSIILYALDKPVFVVDAYTRRIFSRHLFFGPDADYQTIQNMFMENLKKDTKVFNEYHALIVALGKDLCRTKPFCERCPLRDLKHRII